MLVLELDSYLIILLKEKIRKQHMWRLIFVRTCSNLCVNTSISGMILDFLFQIMNWIWLCRLKMLNNFHLKMNNLIAISQIWFYTALLNLKKWLKKLIEFYKREALLLCLSMLDTIEQLSTILSSLHFWKMELTCLN